jgi:hypothetical protein
MLLGMGVRRPAFVFVPAFAVALGLLPAAVFAQPIALGPQFEVTDGQTNNGYGRLAATGDGGFVVVWQADDGGGYGVVGRRFDGDAAPLGAAFPVNGSPVSGSPLPDVAVRADGGFVVTWESYAQFGDDDDIVARRYDGTGTPEGTEFQVNTHTTEAQRNPAVAAHGTGGFVVVWDSYSQAANDDTDDVFGQRFDAAGAPLGSEFPVNVYTTGQWDDPAVAAWPGGEFVVVWGGDDSYSYHDGVFGQRFDVDGVASGGEFAVEAAVVDPTPRVATRPGGFVVSFGGLYGIGARRFDDTGTPLGASLPVSAGLGSYPDVAADAAGRFLVVWEGGGADGDATGVLGRLFDAGGSPVGGEFVVNTYTTGYQGGPAVASDEAGGFVVTWSGQGPSGQGVFARRFATSAAAPIGVAGNKLIIVDKVAAAGKAKVVYVSKDQTAGITKGTGTDVEAVSATFTFAYDSVGGAFALPVGASDGTRGWKVNSAAVAKFVNKEAPEGITGAKVGVIKPGKLLKIVGKSLGDTPIDLFADGEPTSPIVTEFAVTNGGDTYRHCSEFDPSDPGVTVVYKEIAGGTGRKLVAKNGTPAACL